MISKMMTAATGVGLMAGIVNAAVSYSYVTDAGSYDASGGSATVKIYLKETLTNGSTSVIAADNGLLGAGYKLTLISGTGVGISGVTVTDGSPPFNTGGIFVTDPRPTNAPPPDAPYFPPATYDPAVTTLTVLEGIGGISGPTPQASLVYLGTVLFSAGVGATDSTFSLGQFNVGSTLTFAEHDLDSDSTNPAYSGVNGATTQFNIVVPEPGMLGLFGLGATLILRRKR